MDGPAFDLLSGPFSQSSLLQPQPHIHETSHEVCSIQGSQLYQEGQSGTGNYNLTLFFKCYITSSSLTSMLHYTNYRGAGGVTFFCLCFLYYVQITPEEEEKKRIRRERNKQAAAKCRNRRRELTDTLQAVSMPPIYRHSSKYISRHS